MVPGCKPLIDIGCKYNAQKVIIFIVPENVGSTYIGLPYLSKYPGQFSNVAIIPVVCTLVIYNFFVSVNEINSHNKSR